MGKSKTLENTCNKLPESLFFQVTTLLKSYNLHFSVSSAGPYNTYTFKATDSFLIGRAKLVHVAKNVMNTIEGHVWTRG